MSPMSSRTGVNYHVVNLNPDSCCPLSPATYMIQVFPFRPNHYKTSTDVTSESNILNHFFYHGDGFLFGPGSHFVQVRWYQETEG